MMIRYMVQRVSRENSADSFFPRKVGWTLPLGGFDSAVL